MRECVVMTTAAERKARREARLLKKEKRKMILIAMWTCLKYIGAIAGTIAAAWWLAVVMWDNPDWALTISWALGSISIGTFLFYKAAK